jgi:hypothetical protein
MCSLNGQNPYLRHYTTLDGLPSNTIYQIYQDSKRFMWFTTDAGVVKFDGSTFTNYQKGDGLSSNDVIRMKEDTFGRIWFFNYNASVNFMFLNKIFNNKSAHFLNAFHGKGFMLDFINYKDCLLFYNLQCEIITMNRYNFSIKNRFFKKAVTLPLKWNSRESVRVAFVENIEDRKLRIWTIYGIYSQKDLFSYPIEEDTSLKIESVYPTKSDYYYAKTTNVGLIKIKKDLKYEKIKLPFDYSKVKFVLEDHEGCLWISAFDEGVFCYKGGHFIKWLDIKEALYLFEDNDKNIWISSQSNGVFLVRREILTQKHIGLESFSSLELKLLSFGSYGGIWCSDGYSIFLYFNSKLFRKNAIPNDNIFEVVHHFKDHSMFIAKRNKYFYILDHIGNNNMDSWITLSNERRIDISIKKILFDNYEKSFVLFDQNRIMEGDIISKFSNLRISYIPGRIYNAYFDCENRLVINGRRNYFFSKGQLLPAVLLSKYDGSIIVDHLIIDHETEIINVDGEKLWLINKSRHYDLLKGSYKSISANIKKLQYYNNALYFSTNSNIYRCDNPKKIIRNEDVYIQLLEIKLRSINDFLFYNDSIYIASKDGLTIMSEAYIRKKVSLPPKPYIKAVLINEINLNEIPNEITLTGRNTISLHYLCIDFSVNSYIYSYYLQGFEKFDSIYKGNNFNITYQNLPKGKYVFKLRVRKANSDWSETLELPIIIKPTFYEYPAFWILVSLIVIFLVIQILIQLKKMRLIRIENSHQLVMLEQKALLSMMNPHFIFNSLGSIQNFLLKNRTGEAIIYLTQFSRLIRQNFNAVNVAVINLDDEINRIKNYLALEQIRMEYKFDYFIDIDEEFSDDVFLIPSMIIQPFVENAVWHGIASIDFKGIIRIKFIYDSDDIIRIIIEDNGVGIKSKNNSPKKSLSHLNQGMKMTKRRLILLGHKLKSKSVLEITPLTPNEKFPGTRIVILLPIYSESDEKQKE